MAMGYYFGQDDVRKAFDSFERHGPMDVPVRNRQMDRLASMCAFYYDELVRDRSGVRCLKFDSYNGRSFHDGLDDGFPPDFKSIASCCETAKDGEALADVCGRALWSVYKESPVTAMSGRLDAAYGPGGTSCYADELDAVGKKWLDAYRSTFQEGMRDAYMVLGDKPPEVAFAFVHHLDRQSFKCLAGSVQVGDMNPVQRDTLQMARMDSVPPLYGSTPKHAELNGYESGTNHYEHTVDYVADRSLSGLICQADLGRDPAGFAESHMGAVRERYADLGRERVNRYFGGETRLCDPSLRLFKKSDTDTSYGLDVVGLGRADSMEALSGQVPVLSGMCSAMYGECAGIADDLVSSDSVKDAARVCANRHYAENSARGLGNGRPVDSLRDDAIRDARESARTVMANAVAWDTLGIYDDLSGLDAGLAGRFMDGLSDDAYANLSRARPSLPARQPDMPAVRDRKPSVQHYVGDMQLSDGSAEAVKDCSF